MGTFTEIQSVKKFLALKEFRNVLLRSARDFDSVPIGGSRLALEPFLVWNGFLRGMSGLLAAGDQLQPRHRMEGAHKKVHYDHFVQRRRTVRRRAENIPVCAKNTRYERHECKDRGCCQRQPVGGAKGGDAPALGAVALLGYPRG